MERLRTEFESTVYPVLRANCQPCPNPWHSSSDSTVVFDSVVRNGAYRMELILDRVSDEPLTGVRMPFGCTGSDCLSLAEQNALTGR